jgi:hypothetical protein
METLCDELVCAGFYLGHPAARAAMPAAATAELLAELRRTRRLVPPHAFRDLPAARAVAALGAPPPPWIHGLWLPRDAADDLLEEEASAPSCGLPPAFRLLRQRLGPAAHDAPARIGYDVLGFAGATCCSWRTERAARAVATRLGIASTDDLLAERERAEALAQELEDDDLGAPVLWRVWCVTQHAVAGA